METIVRCYDLTASVAKKFSDDVVKLIPSSQFGIVIDFSDVVVVDSSGIGSLVVIHNKMMESGTELRLRNVSPDILHMFNLMHLDRHFQIEDSRL